MNKQQGLSLIELMIAITLGLILITGVLQVFISSKTVYTTQQALSRVQETGRLAIEFLARDIRMAGYRGCGSRFGVMKITNILNQSNTFPFDYLTSVRGYTSGALPVGLDLNPAPIANTDLFVLRSAAGAGVQLVQNNTDSLMSVANSGVENGACTDNSDRISGICAFDIVAVADCTKARVFQVTGVQQNGGFVDVEYDGAGGFPGNSMPNWGGDTDNSDEVFRAGAELLSLSTTTYFIATGTSGRPSLWQNTNGDDLELLEGVEDMSVLYGVDTNQDGVPENYSRAEVLAAQDWDRVVALRVELLVASIDDGVLAETQTYSFEGVDNVAPNPVDRRLRQVFSTTVGIRSRSL